jgi:hypothetical protein
VRDREWCFPSQRTDRRRAERNATEDANAFRRIGRGSNKPVVGLHRIGKRGKDNRRRGGDSDENRC